MVTAIIIFSIIGCITAYITLGNKIARIIKKDKEDRHV